MDLIQAIPVIVVALAATGLIADVFSHPYEPFKWGSIYTILTVVFIIIDFSLIGFIVWVFRKFSKLKTLPPPPSGAPVTPAAPQIEVLQSWDRIRKLANSANPSDWNMAVIRADALLEDVLMHLGYEGTTLAERLKIIDTSKMPSLDRVWSAHRLRNMIAHDPLEQHTKETIIQALRSYEQALKELGMMEESK